MFEDSIFSSAPLPISATKKWATSAAITTQLAVLGLVVIYPMLRPTALSLAMTAPIIILPTPRPIPKPIVIKTELAHTSSATAIPVAAVEHLLPSGHTFSRPVPGIPPDDSLTLTTLTSMTGTGTGFGSAIGDSIGSATTPTVVKATPQKIRLSSGVSAGMLLAPITPVYPRIAIAAHQEGTVTLTATIDKTGHIIGLQATSGPAMLRTAAIDAVRAARYKPYLLNGEPTEVETTISVIFHLGNAT